MSDVVIKLVMNVERKGRLPKTIEERLGLVALLGEQSLYLCLHAGWPHALFHLNPQSQM